MNCVCDYEPVSVYKAKTHTARKQHHCDECGCHINPGERYENVFGIWEGDAQTYRTCCRCLNLREYVKAHIPCFCWWHCNMLQDATDTIEDIKHESPGLYFGYGRLMVAIRRERKRQRPTTQEQTGGEG